MRIGIDLGGTKTAGILMAPDGAVIERRRTPTPTSRGYGAICENVCEIVRQLEHAAGQPCRVGIGTPGALFAQTGLMRNSNTTCLNGRALREDLSRMLSRDVRIENDANCFALSEAVDGAAAGARVVFGIIMGTGVGGGIVIDGRIHRGRHHVAGEWGHNVLDPDGPPCYCGRRGCVETLLSGPALHGAYDPGLAARCEDARAVAAEARAGDRDAAKVIERFLDNFGRAVATVVNILDPDVIVIGGGLSNLDELYEQGPTRIARHVFADDFDTPVRRNRFGDSSGVRGAAWLWPGGGG